MAEEVVRLGEQRERRRPGRVGVDHVQDRLLGRVREVVRDLLGAARVGVVRGQPGDVTFQRAHLRRVRARVAGDVELGRRVRLQAERRGVVLLGGEQAGDVAGQLAERPGRVGAGHGHAVAVGRGGLDGPAHVGAGLVVALVRAEHEHRVGRGDAVGGQPLEERAERGVVVLRLRDVARGAAAERGGRAGARGQARDVLVAVDVGDVAVHHGDAGLQHVGHVGQRLRGVDGAEPGEARVVGEERAVDLVAVLVDQVPGRVGDLEPVVGQVRRARAELRRDVPVPEQRLEAAVTARLVRQHVGHRGRRRGGLPELRPPWRSEQNALPCAQCTATPT